MEVKTQLKSGETNGFLESTLTQVQSGVDNVKKDIEKKATEFTAFVTDPKFLFWPFVH